MQAGERVVQYAIGYLTTTLIERINGKYNWQPRVLKGE